MPMQITPVRKRRTITTAAAQRQEWRQAYEHLHGVGMTALGAEDLQSLADAAWWTGKLDEALEARQRAFAKYVQAGEPRRAALACVGRRHPVPFPHSAAEHPGD